MRSLPKVCLKFPHCMKNIQIWSFFWSIFSLNTGKYGPKKPLYLDIFHTVPNFELILFFSKTFTADFEKTFVSWKMLLQHWKRVIYHLPSLFNYTLFQFFFAINTTTHFDINKTILPANTSLNIALRFLTSAQRHFNSSF